MPGFNISLRTRPIRIFLASLVFRKRGGPRCAANVNSLVTWTISSFPSSNNKLLSFFFFPSIFFLFPYYRRVLFIYLLIYFYLFFSNAWNTRPTIFAACRNNYRATLIIRSYAPNNAGFPCLPIICQLPGRFTGSTAAPAPVA